jgi:hypothetical protein
VSTVGLVVDLSTYFGTAGSANTNVMSVQGIATAATAANQATSNTNTLATANALGTTTDTPCAVPTSATACTIEAVMKALTNVANSTGAVVPTAGNTGGATPGHILSAASNNSTNIKASSGTLFELTYQQTTTTLMDIRLYDTASAPTCSSSTGVVANYVVQSNAVSAGATINLGPVGKKFASGIGICITGANADNDNTNAVTGLNVNYSYN